MQTRVTYKPASASDYSRIKGILVESGLPTTGVDDWVENFVIAVGDDGSWAGTAGFELYGDSSLLRSVVVKREYRSQGIGRKLVELALTNARDKGAKVCYLLTEDASEYFARLGFETVRGDEVDEAVRKSKEFTEACGETALAMRKALS